MVTNNVTRGYAYDDILRKRMAFSAVGATETGAPEPGAADSTEEPEPIILDDSKKLHEKFEQHMKEMHEKLKNGETQPLYQIGAQAFTVEEWDKFLANFDTAQEAIRAALEARTGEPSTEPEKTGVTTMEADEPSLEALVARSTICSYPSAEYAKLEQAEKAQAIKENAQKAAEAADAIQSAEAESAEKKAASGEVKFITWYTEEGIFCRQAGQTEGYLWTIPFENHAQYDKVMAYLDEMRSVENPQFAADKSFWTAFLAG